MAERISTSRPSEVEDGPVAAPSDEERKHQADYEAIEAAVMETARGRWFLSEYARRNRAADTGKITSSIERLETALQRQKIAEIDPTPFRQAVGELAAAVARAKRDFGLGASRDGRTGTAALLAEIRSAARSSRDAAGHVAEIAGALRNSGGRESDATVLEAQAVAVRTAASVQEGAAEKLRKVAALFTLIDERIAAMARAYAAPAASAVPEAAEPAAASAAPAESAIDTGDDMVFFIEPEEEADSAGPDEGEPAPPLAADPTRDMSRAEKVALFS